ncbi:DUF645 family protein, partial [Vibrio cholerae]
QLLVLDVCLSNAFA